MALLIALWGLVPVAFAGSKKDADLHCYTIGHEERISNDSAICKVFEGEDAMELCVSSRKSAPDPEDSRGMEGKFRLILRRTQGKRVLKKFDYAYLVSEGAAGTSYRDFFHSRQEAQGAARGALSPKRSRLSLSNLAQSEGGGDGRIELEDGEKHCLRQ